MSADRGRASPRAVTQRLLQRSAELRDEWARDRGSAVDNGASALLRDIVAAGAFVAERLPRDQLMTELGWWRRWYAAERGAFVDPGPLAAFTPAAGTDYEPITIEAFLKKLEHGESVYRRVIHGGDFAAVRPAQRLAEAFAAGKIVNCLFEECNFEGAELGPEVVYAGQGANLIYVDFVDCTWRRVRWPGARASSLAFRDADVSRADFEGAVFADVLFRAFGGTQIGFARASFTECRFTDASFVDSDFTGATFTWCRFEGSTFKGCDLSETVFQGCDLRGTVFAGGSLSQALFSECGLAGADLKEANPVGRRGGRAYPVLADAQWDTSFDVHESWTILRDADTVTTAQHEVTRHRVDGSEARS